MYRKCLVSIVTFAFLLLSSGPLSHAKSDLATLQDEDVRILLIYSNDENILTENVRKLDLLLHHFTKHVSIISDSDLTKNDIESITHVIYYGEHDKGLGRETSELIESFSGPIIAIGENIEQLSTFQSFTIRDEVQLNEISLFNNKAKRTTEGPVTSNRIHQSDELQTLLYGYTDGMPLPIMVKATNTYYLAVTQLDNIILTFFAELLHDIFPNDHPTERKAYIHLKSIHPQSDPEKVLEVAEALVERNIPFSLAVTPVYTNPETLEQVHLKDAEELLDVLHYVQQVDGSVITNGYTNDQFLGYEFWDQKLDQYITEMDGEGNREKMPVSEDFPNKSAYDSFMKVKKQEEKTYLDNRINRAIHEQIKEGIYPLAFTAPLHAMSDQGYETVSNHYSAMFGCVQLTDKSYRSQYAPPFVTTGSFLNGITLYPETFGDITDFDANPHPKMVRKLEEASIVRDSVIGATYQTYLGSAYIDDFIKQVESIPNVSWLNLRETEQVVRAEKVNIQSEMAEVVVTNELTWVDEWKEPTEQLTVFEKILWAVTLLVFLFIIMFLLFALHLRLQLKKRLFRERRLDG